MGKITKMEKYQGMLEVLIKLLNLTYSESRKDRKRLHDIEWADDNIHSLSILAEAEIRADTVVGIASSRKLGLKNNELNYHEILVTNSLYASEAIVKWIAENGSNYRGFTAYILAIENLNNATLNYLRNLKEEDKG